MSRKKYIFGTKNKEELTYNPHPALYKYYQICYFKHPTTGKYHTRKCVFNEKGEFVSVTEERYNDAQFQKFFKEHRDNEYKAYATYDLDVIEYPRYGEIIIAQSPILNNGY